MNSIIRMALVGFILSTGVSCSKPAALQTRFQKTFNFDLPENAQNIVVSEPTELEKWNQNYLIVEWNLSTQEMEEFLSKRLENYTRWRPLSEFSVGNRFFTREQMPKALMAEWHAGDASHVIAADLSNNKIFACFWLD